MITAIVLMFMGYYPTMWMRYIAGFLFGFHGGFYFMIMTPILINNWFARRKGLAMGISDVEFGNRRCNPFAVDRASDPGYRLAARLCVHRYTGHSADHAVGCLRLPPQARRKGLKPFGWREEDEVNEENKEGFVKAGVPQRYAYKSISFICRVRFHRLYRGVLDV